MGAVPIRWVIAVLAPAMDCHRQAWYGRCDIRCNPAPTTRKGHAVPTPFARNIEEGMLRITFGQHGASWESREYKLQHSERRNTRRMLKEDAR